MSSFQGGLATAALGAFCHYFIATGAATVFYLASRKLKFLVEHAILSGLVYGIAVYIVMSYIVLPLSAYHVKVTLPPVSAFIKDVTILMFLIGLPTSLVVRRYSSIK